MQISDAQAAYARQRALVDLRLSELEALLQVHEAARPFSWHRLRALEHVEAQIADLVAFLAAE